ncbi:MAG TPA: hypothetical protein PLY93_15530, partial [Turneriella sp.]|nr:hypothetical protein [Turneriella sp.]
EKAKQLAAAQEKVQAKVELVKSDGISDKKFTLSLGLGVNHGLLLVGEHLGLITTLNLFASMQMMRYLEPHIRFEGYYGLAKENVSNLVGGSILSGLGITAHFGRFALMPYIDGGLFMSRIDAKAGIFNTLLPSVGAGFSITFMPTPTWGLALQTHAQYVLDMDMPALFIGASLASVLRF